MATAANNRRARKAAAEETLEVIRTGYFSTPAGQKINIADLIATSVDGSRVYSPEKLKELSDSFLSAYVPPGCSTVFEVTSETTLTAARRLIIEENTPHVCVLNFASGKNAGGGFLNGSQAQEESLARSSTLYLNQTEKGGDYYQANRRQRAPFYTHNMIWTPQVPVFRDDVTDRCLDAPYTVDIVTAPAVNAGWGQRSPQSPAPSRERIRSVQMERTDYLLSLMTHRAASTLILGAWGCGVFRQSPQDIAEIFGHLLFGKFKDLFKRVVFAIYYTNDSTNFDAFQAVFTDEDNRSELKGSPKN